MTHQRPVSAFIHGPHHGAWVPTIEAESNFLRHVVTACSDALGGPAQCPGTLQSLQANQGVLVHMRWRAQLFSRKQLEPFFAERWEPTLACMYQDRDGQVYKYFADEQTHRMLGPDGRELYARVTGLNRYPTRLNLPGWPAISDGAILGLNPKVRYALVPGVPDRTGIAVTRIPDGVCISRFYETGAFAVIAMDATEPGKPAQGEVAFRSATGFAEVLVNDQPAAAPKTSREGRTGGDDVHHDVPRQLRVRQAGGSGGAARPVLRRRARERSIHPDRLGAGPGRRVRAPVPAQLRGARRETVRPVHVPQLWQRRGSDGRLPGAGSGQGLDAARVPAEPAGQVRQLHDRPAVRERPPAARARFRPEAQSRLERRHARQREDPLGHGVPLLVGAPGRRGRPHRAGHARHRFQGQQQRGQPVVVAAQVRPRPAAGGELPDADQGRGGAGTVTWKFPERRFPDPRADPGEVFRRRKRHGKVACGRPSGRQGGRRGISPG